MLIDPDKYQEYLKRLKNYSSGTIPSNELGEVFRKTDSHLFFKCPCGASDHYGSRRHELIKDCDGNLNLLIGDVIYCAKYSKVWHIRLDIQQVISREEILFNELMDKFKKKGLLGKKVSAEEAFRLYTEQGCPAECLDIDDMKKYNELLNQHREKSRGKRYD